jgi:hypothetical protein
MLDAARAGAGTQLADIGGYSPFYRTDETGTQFSGHSFIGKER